LFCRSSGRGGFSTNNNEREAFRWYRQGKRDGETAAKNAASGDHEVACFLYQQGAEKLLKAALYLKGERPVVGHATTHLAARCSEYESSFKDLLEACQELDVFYIPTRYPNGVPDGAPYEFFGSRHSERGAIAYNKVLEKITPLFRHLGG
jgi:HEPN domain-containing protein